MSGCYKSGLSCSIKLNLIEGQKIPSGVTAISPVSLGEVLEVVVDQLDEAGLLVPPEHAQHLVLVRRAGVQDGGAAAEEHDGRLLLDRVRVEASP